MLATVFVGIANAIPPPPPPPFFPSPWTLGGPSQGPGPQVQACNVPGASEIGYNGNANGSSTGYHTYANVPGFSAGDYCVTPPGAAFATCTEGTVFGAIANFTTNVGNPVPPNTANLTQARRDLTNELENWALGQTCDGILGTGSDGEYEFGDLTAILDVRDDGPLTDHSPLVSHVSTVTTKGSDVKDCINPKATHHHGTDTDIYVLDAVWGTDIDFSVDGDWSRPDWLSAGGNDENDNPSPTQCGGDGVEPCNYYLGGTGGTIPDIESGRKNVTTAVTDLATEAKNNVMTYGVSLKAIAATLEYEGGCNPLDFSYAATGGHFSMTGAPCGASTLADLSSGFDCDYTASAAGFLIVSVNGAIAAVDDPLPGGDSPDAVRLLNPGTLGWVWSGAPSIPCIGAVTINGNPALPVMATVGSTVIQLTWAPAGCGGGTLTVNPNAIPITGSGQSKICTSTATSQTCTVSGTPQTNVGEWTWTVSNVIVPVASGSVIQTG